MKMRVFVFALCVAAGVSAPALAYENFIPLGTGYSTEVGELTEPGSEEGQAIIRADEYETEIYLEGRKAIELDSRLRQFSSEAENTGADTFIDY
jgi:hypothetical protein